MEIVAYKCVAKNKIWKPDVKAPAKCPYCQSRTWDKTGHVKI